MSDVDNKVKMIVEGLLLAAGRPLTLDNIARVFAKRERPDKKELCAVMDAIAEECDDRGFELKEVASGFRFQVKQELSEWVAKLWEERPPRYTRALLETLALIAYRQPITRGDIEEIRGVSVSPNIIRTLIDREWIRVVGHRDVPGRPAMFATTKQFLDYFNLQSLQDLPPLSEIKELVGAEPELDLTQELANSRILDMPDESLDEESRELTAAEEAQLIAEEEAVELSKKPLDEILQMGVPEELLEKDRAEQEERERLKAEEELEREQAESMDEELEDDDSDEIDLDIGLSDDDIAANEEFERTLQKSPIASEDVADEAEILPADADAADEQLAEIHSSEESQMEDQGAVDENEDIDSESNVIRLHSNENSVLDSTESTFDSAEEISASSKQEVESDSHDNFRDDDFQDDKFSDESDVMTFIISDKPEEDP